MKVNVTEQGLLIPKEFLEGIRAVEIRRENDQIILTSTVADDPIWGLGSEPISLGIADAAEKHDRTSEVDERGWPIGFFERIYGICADDPIVIDDGGIDDALDDDMEGVFD
jgi:hypothetical protein